jgi:hypothetical protein
MNKLLLTFILFALLYTNLFPQWTTEQNLNFTIQSNTNVSSFVDENGIHIVYSRNGGIKYALINSQGNVLKYDKVVEQELSGSAFANIIAVGNNVYIIYIKNNYIRIARSTNLGDIWNNNYDSRPLTSYNCTKILAQKEGNTVHITWCESRDQNKNDVHYIKYTPSELNWTEYKLITEYEQNGGDNPDLICSSPKIEVNYTTPYFYRPRNRERVSLNNWNSPEDIAFNQHITNSNIETLKPFIIGDQLNVIYKANYSSYNYSGNFISHSYRNLNSSTWYANATELPTVLYNPFRSYSHVVNSTSDGKIHIIYKDYNENSWVHRSLTGTVFSDVIAQVAISEYETNSLISCSNDLYLLYTNNINSSGYIKFRHYDKEPLAPDGFALSNSGSPYYHPVLNWSSIKDPDVRLNTSGGVRVERRLWNNELQTWSTWSQIASIPGTSISYTDNNIYNASGAGQGKAEYKLRSVDYNNNYSPYTSALYIRYGISPEKTGSLFNPDIKPDEFYLYNNYPNPFNPLTRIDYALAEDSKVIIKVYNLLGIEIAELTNEFKPAGFYKAEFDASNFGSGVYIYSFTAVQGSRIIFSATKPMMLIK